MKLYDYPKAKQIIVSGDLHEAFTELVEKLCNRYRFRNTLLVVAGDESFGFAELGHYQKIYDQVAEKLRIANNWVVFVRGNNDDPTYFAEERIAYERWSCVPDYSIIQACGHNILCVGGAVSVDRRMRQMDDIYLKEQGYTTVCWWPDEIPSYKPKEIAAIPHDINIDTVVSHSCPSFFNTYYDDEIEFWSRDDPALIKDCARERKTMDKILSCLGRNHHIVDKWFFSHFHASLKQKIDGIQYVMLDDLEFKKIT